MNDKIFKAALAGLLENLKKGDIYVQISVSL